MKFRSAYEYYESGESYHSPSGSDIAFEYSTYLDEKGLECYGITSRFSQRERINAALSGSTVPDIISRFTRGETNLIGSVDKTLSDITGFPKDFMEAQNLLVKARNHFENLPVDVRASYNHSVSSFLDSVQDGSFLKLHGQRCGYVKLAKKPIDTNVDLIKSVQELNQTIKSSRDMFHGKEVK